MNRTSSSLGVFLMGALLMATLATGYAYGFLTANSAPTPRFGRWKPCYENALEGTLQYMFQRTGDAYLAKHNTPFPWQDPTFRVPEGAAKNAWISTNCHAFENPDGSVSIWMDRKTGRNNSMPQWTPDPTLQALRDQERAAGAH